MAARKRLFVGLLAFLVIIGACLYYFFGFLPQKREPAPAVNAIPESVLFFYKGTDFISFYKKFNEQGFLKDLLSNQAVNRIHKQILRLDSLVRQDEKFSDYLKKNELIISVHRTSSTSIDALAVMQVNNKFTLDDINKLVKTSQKYLFVKRDFRNIKIYDYQLTPQKSLVVFTLCEGNLIMSENALLVEDAVSTLLQNGREETPLGKSLGSVKNETLFINFSKFSSLLEMYLRPDSKNTVDGLKFFAGLGKYECDFQKDYIYLRGNVAAWDSLNDLISFFSGQKPSATDIHKIIPDRTAVLLNYNPDDFEAYYEKYTARLRKLKKLADYQSDVRNFENKYLLNLKQDIIPLIEGEFSLAINEPVTDDLANCSSAIIKVKDTEKAIKIFNSYNENDFKGDSAGKKSEYKDYKIYRSNVVESLPLLFGRNFKMFQKAYFANIRDYLVFSVSYTNLKRFIDDYTNNKTLSTSTEYNKFSEKFISESNFLFYLNPRKSLNLPENFADTSFLSGLHKNVDYLDNFSFFIFDIANNNNSFYSEIIANYTSKAPSGKENLWSLELEAPMTGKPVAVKNSQGKAPEIFLFDSEDNLYNISSSGMINWKRKLDSKAVGMITPVDLFDNGKTQILVTTVSEVHIIDRQGKNAGSYPIKLRNEAIAGPCVVPGKDRVPLKYFIGCENNTIYGFEKTGKPVSGWNPKKIKGNLTAPLKTFSRAGVNYLYGITDKGILYLWDVKGKEIFKPVELKTMFRNPFYMIFGKNDKTTYIISADTAGKTWFINFDGEVKFENIGKWTGNVIFMAGDLNNNGSRELIYISGNRLEAYNPDGKKGYNFKMDYSAGDLAELVSMKNKNYLAFLNSGNDQVVVIDQKGKLLQNFPFPGSSGFIFFDINNDNRNELIRSDGKMLYISRF